jgi:tRNA A-37 threonylcarbamoyl transferase component Bud32
LHLLDQLRPPRPVAGVGEGSSNPDARYVLRGLHAEGGIGQVWLAFDNELGREVALKALRPDRAADPALAARFLHEAHVTGRLQHPGVVPVYELAPGEAPGSVDEPPFYTMRFVQGRTLTEAIRAYHVRRNAGAASPVEKTTLLTAFVSVCHTIAYAHARGVIHRDLKPDNVALGDYGEVVVLDWGFAKDTAGSSQQAAGSEDDSSPPVARGPRPANQSVAGQIMGTPAYMAPEQAGVGRSRIDERTDVYGLGAILYELLTSQPPYPGDDATEVLGRLREGPPPRPNAVRPRVSLALEAICLKAMVRDPADRYPSATAVAREVQHWLADEPVEAYPEPPPARAMRFGRRHPAFMAGALALIVTGLFGAGLAEVRLHQEQALAAEERAKAATSHAQAMERAQEGQQLRMYLHRIALAERTIAAHNPSGAISLLNDCPNHLRNWEWYAWTASAALSCTPCAAIRVPCTSSPSRRTAGRSRPAGLTTRFGSGTQRAAGRTSSIGDTRAWFTTSVTAPTGSTSPVQAGTARFASGTPRRHKRSARSASTKATSNSSAIVRTARQSIPSRPTASAPGTWRRARCGRHLSRSGGRGA